MTKAPRKLLVVEDDPGLQRQLRWQGHCTLALVWGGARPEVARYVFDRGRPGGGTGCGGGSAAVPD